MSISVKMNTLGKYLDQPALINKMNKTMPWALSTIGLGYAIQDSYKAPEGQKKKKFIQDASILTFTIASALLATKGLTIKGKEIIEGIAEFDSIDLEVVKGLKKDFKGTNTEKMIQKVVDGKVLSLNKIKELSADLKNKGGIERIIPDAESEEPFSELVKLSWVGLIPVLGGMAGGVVGDILTKDHWKKKFPDKIKEGSYQYLNNIFLCNVGAGIAMLAMNKLNVQNKAARATAMLAGVVGVGIVAGSAIANFVGKNLINPIFDKNKKFPKDFKTMVKDLNSERHPEAVDLSLHIDDIASVGFLSGFKWIGPVLPMLYSVSAYRAGIGYRNGDGAK